MSCDTRTCTCSTMSCDTRVHAVQCHVTHVHAVQCHVTHVHAVQCHVTHVRVHAVQCHVTHVYMQYNVMSMEHHAYINISALGFQGVKSLEVQQYLLGAQYLASRHLLWTFKYSHEVSLWSCTVHVCIYTIYCI